MSNKNYISKFLPHLAALAIFFCLSFGFNAPVFQGKTISQNDIQQALSASQEVIKFKKETGETSLWNNSLFSGMPAYVYMAKSQTNIFFKIYTWKRFFPKPANYFLFFLIAYFLMFVLIGVDPWLSIIGAVGFTFVTYNVAIVEAGHAYKVMALVYTALMIAGVIRTYRGDYAIGASVFLIGFGVQLASYHYQITYYIGMMLGLYVLFELFGAIREKTLPTFLKSTAILALASLLAIGTSASKMWTTLEYSKVSTRGESELNGEESSGLDKDYAFGWSHGIGETFSLLIPGMMGGSSQEELSADSELFQDLRKKGARIKAPFPAPLYWGDMPFTSAPFYFGSIMCFLFLLGCFLVKGRMKWWLISSTLMFMLLSWGKHLPLLSDVLFNYLPMYNKFRAVNTMMVIAQITASILAILALDNILKEKVSKAEVKRALMVAGGICAGTCLVFWTMGASFFDFVSPGDARLEQAGFDLGALTDDRIALLKKDSLRSLVFVLLGLAILWLQNIGKVTWKVWVPVLGFLISADILGVDKRYLNENDFVTKRKASKPPVKSKADIDILKDTDPNFRVVNLAGNPFNEATTSYYHKSIGGYHAAKMRRYSDLIDAHLSQNNQEVFNMLNTKYFIRAEADGNQSALKNPGAYGNAWFVNSVKWVSSADEELAALGSETLRTSAIVDERYRSMLDKDQFTGMGTVDLVDYKPNHLTYNTNTSSDELLVFSEIYYNNGKGWQAYLDGKAVDHLRVNYVLRGMPVPSGKHTVEFKFFPRSYYTGEKISLGCSILSVLFICGMGYTAFRRKNLSTEASI